eukprot:jgi/Botrbrau1/19818/Bobra.0124s0059.2
MCSNFQDFWSWKNDLCLSLHFNILSYTRNKDSVKEMPSLTMQGLWQTYDSSVQNLVVKGLLAIGFKEIAEPPSVITGNLPFVKSPTPIVTAIMVYLAVTVTGKWMISARGEIRDKKMSRTFFFFVQAHNLFLVLLSSFMSSSAAYLAWKHKYKFWGQAYNPAEKDMGIVIYVFYLSKYVEFLDTFIMVAKGAVRQISFLHVYHHVSISFIWWAIARVAPGGDGACHMTALLFCSMVLLSYGLTSCVNVLVALMWSAATHVCLGDGGAAGTGCVAGVVP